MHALPLSMSLFLVAVFLFALLPYTEAKTNYAGNNTNQFCPPTKCGTKGPEIRFPFRLTTQPASCGLNGFELSCLNNNTLLRLPSSSSNHGDFYVQDISYLDSIITIIHAEETACPVKTLLPDLNLTTSKFSFIEEWFTSWCIAIANCTEKIVQRSSLYGEVGPIDCMSDDRNFVYVFPAYEIMDMLPANCIMSQTTWIPAGSDFHNTVTNFLKTRRMVMGWPALDGCYHCEKSGNFCGFNFTTNSTICVKNKGKKTILS